MTMVIMMIMMMVVVVMMTITSRRSHTASTHIQTHSQARTHTLAHIEASPKNVSPP